ncbi:dentin sialophosphoprotein-like isoform X2 [Mercenaria mercenaria]|uniref:dentin sialophosphoprotein-like isoform X2 n=1 Tax=Mercenaria mercenaria TaxID=6596 RepID=UPI00234E9866|nr:dentin sialophosphoprotein-like isoform X2 [Mercenaria mercenaria]
MNRSSRKKIHSTEKHEMELRSCLISNQKLIRSSKEIFNFAEKIASECSLLTSDLILAAVWHCLNQTQPTESSTLSNIAVESSSEEHRIQKQDKDRTRKKPVSDSEENRACQSTENAVNENKCDLHADKPKDDREIKKKQPEKEAARNVDAENDEKKEVWIVGESESKTDDIDKQQINQLRSHSDTASGDQSQTIVTNGPDSQNNTEVDTKESKGVCEITNVQNYSSSEPKLDKNIKLHNRTNVATKETNEQVNIDKNVNKFNVTRDENKTDTQDLSVQEKVKSVPAASLKDSQSKQNEGKGQNEKKSIADVEVISIDDEDSNDIPGGLDIASITEFAVVARDKNEEIAEEKEPDYFDMDCDEIDDDNDGDEYEEMLDFTTDETDKSEKYKEESNVKTNTIQKDADVTIISDDEDDCEVKGSAINALTSPSKCESLNETGNRSNTGKSQLNTTSSKKQAVSEGTRRKQSLTNVMEDLTGSVEEKTKGKGLMDRSGEKVHTRIICPAMEHLDSMSMPKDESSSEHAGDRNSSVPSVSDSDSTSTSAVAVLGLMPVGDVQKSVDSAASTTEESSLSQIFPTLASNQSIYVSSSMVHGSIPSLPPVQDLHHVSNLPGNRFADIYQGSDTVTCPSQGSSATPGSFQFDQPDLQAQTSYYSEEYSSVRSPGDEFSSPPRKKRLLDYDKKWHMEPKFSPEQDKDDALVKLQEGTLVRIKTEPEDFELQVNTLNEMPVDIENKAVLHVGSCSDTEVNKHRREFVNTTKEALLNTECVIPARSEDGKREMQAYDIVMNTNNEMSDDILLKVEVPVNTDDETSDSIDKEMSGNTETGRKRQFYSPLMKLHFIERLKNGESQTSIHRDTGIPGSTLRTWLKSEQQIRRLLNFKSRVKGRSKSKKMETRVEKKRENYTIYEKLKTIARVHSGESRSNVCRDLDLAESTLRGWLKDESRLKEEIFAYGCHSRQKNKGSKCKLLSGSKRTDILDGSQMVFKNKEKH